jgi:hypothetical protein
MSPYFELLIYWLFSCETNILGFVIDLLLTSI